MKNKGIYWIIGIVVVLVLGYFVYKTSKSGSMSQTNPSGSNVVKVVAAENFYGDIVKQLGGDKVQVLSILSDPNADPHEYESNVQDGKAVANAQLVIKN